MTKLRIASRTNPNNNKKKMVFIHFLFFLLCPFFVMTNHNFEFKTIRNQTLTTQTVHNAFIKSLPTPG